METRASSDDDALHQRIAYLQTIVRDREDTIRQRDETIQRRDDTIHRLHETIQAHLSYVTVAFGGDVSADQEARNSIKRSSPSQDDVAPQQNGDELEAAAADDESSPNKRRKHLDDAAEGGELHDSAEDAIPFNNGPDPAASQLANSRESPEDSIPFHGGTELPSSIGEAVLAAAESDDVANRICSECGAVFATMSERDDHLWNVHVSAGTDAEPLQHNGEPESTAREDVDDVIDDEVDCEANGTEESSDSDDDDDDDDDEVDGSINDTEAPEPAVWSRQASDHPESGTREPIGVEGAVWIEKSRLADVRSTLADPKKSWGQYIKLLLRAILPEESIKNYVVSNKNSRIPDLTPMPPEVLQAIRDEVELQQQIKWERSKRVEGVEWSAARAKFKPSDVNLSLSRHFYEARKAN